jgi:hypothetical protein
MLTYEKARICYDTIRDADISTRLQPLRRDLYLKALDYARIRADWMVSPREKRIEIDQRRRLAHNAFIDACNILSRTMASEGEDNSWRAELGDDRKNIGDFACYIECFLGIEAR